MDERKILKELLRETHDARMRRMVALGREARTKPAAAEVVAAFARGDVFARMLALQSVFGSGDGAAAARAAADPSHLIRGRAIRLVALFSDDAAATALLVDGRPSLRRPLVRHLRARARRGPIDALLDALAAQGARDLPRYLPFASEAGLLRHAETALDRATPAEWGRLAKLHPDAALALLDRRLESSPAAGARLRGAANAVLSSLSRNRPEAAVGLARRLLLRFPLGTLSLDALAAVRPNEVGAMLVASADETGRVGPRPRPERLEEIVLLPLLAKRPELFANPAGWLRRLAPSRRDAAFRAAGSAWRDATGAASPAVLTYLSRETRETEARRHLASPAFATSHAARLPYAALLPFDEARAAVAPFLGHPDPDLRAAALAPLLSSVRFERGRLADALALVAARKNEQDPVRLVMLSALARLPTRAFTAERLDALGEVLRQALDAADHSPATTAACQSLAVRLLPAHPAFGATWLEALVRERGTILLGNLEALLGDVDAKPLEDALAPLLAAWGRRERDGQTVVFAKALGARLERFESLHPHLERIARESRAWASDWALDLLLRRAPARFAAIVPRLLADDRSWGTQPAVYRHLHRRRQDLLDPYLGRKAWAGRFSTGKTRLVLPFDSGCWRWTPAQQASFAKTLEELTDPRQTDVDTPTVLRSLRQRIALTSTSHEVVFALAQDATRPAVRDAALRALARLDTDAGVAVLVAALADDRARVAAYALRRAVLDLPSREALLVLRGAPLRLLTVAKEILRLAGELRGAEALVLLREVSEAAGKTAEGGKRPVHRDLRVALLRAYWGHLDQEIAWQEIERAASESDPALVSGLVRLPSDGLSTSQRERFVGVLARLLGHGDASVRCDVLLRLASDPIEERDGRLFSLALERLASNLPSERSAAVQAVVRSASAENAARVAAALAGLGGNRRAQKALLDAIAGWTPHDAMRLLPVVRAAIAALASDAATAPLRAALLVAALPASERADALASMARTAEMTADVLRVVCDAMAPLSARAVGAEVDVLAERFAHDGDERLRRIALAALVARSEAGRGPGWTPERLERLRAFRRDSSTLVSSAAQFTLPSAEEEAGPAPG